MKLFIGLLLFAAADPGQLNLKLRSRTEAFRGSGQWKEVHFDHALDPKQTAIVICDMWDKHWCRGATERVNELAKRMNPVLEAARKRGITIVHAPSDTMRSYTDHPSRLAIQRFPTKTPPKPLELTDPALPIDDSRGGCDTGDKQYKAWTREHSGLRIDQRDFISDSGPEIYNMMQALGIKNILIMGVHTNMCVLNRTFAIKQMTRWGIPAILVRDLTDAMYDPQDAPRVSHEAGTELVIQHIEKYWVPTMLSKDLLAALR
jgi:nicotinamidase-related amidase